MKRLRILFAIFTVVLLAPIALLVQRSLDSLALEERMQQATVAERIFDEIERNLSNLLAAEDARPVDSYERGGVDEDAPFVVSRFEVEARDAPAAISSFAPREDRQAGAPPAVGLADREFAGGSAAVDSEAGKDESAPTSRRVPLSRAPAMQQDPGTTVRLNGGEQAALPELKESGAKAKSADISEYDVLRSLNKAARERISDRSVPAAPAADTGDREDLRASYDTAEVLDFRPDAFGPGRMTGRAVGADRVMLYRTVARGGTLYQQGAVYDVAALGEWLRTRSIGDTGLGDRAALAFFVGGAAPLAARESSFRHRFAAPFADLSAELTLRLASGGGGRYVEALSFGLLAATLLGLALLYRSVAVTMRFAERRSNFAAAVSHELKTPLTAIRMYGEMLRDDMVPSESKRNEYYRHITSESERLSRLINNVLEFAKLEKGNRRGRSVVAPVAATLAEVVEMMRPHAAEQHFELYLKVAPDAPPAYHEPDALAQVLWNLIDNALKYARGAIDRRVEIEARRDAGGKHLVIAARDHGPGVDSGHLGEIFSPFYRGETELTRTTAGAGLGLALVRMLVESMGGSVRGFNHPGGGFAVELSLPVAEPSKPAAGRR